MYREKQLVVYGFSTINLYFTLKIIYFCTLFLSYCDIIVRKKQWKFNVNWEYLGPRYLFMRGQYMKENWSFMRIVTQNFSFTKHSILSLKTTLFLCTQYIDLIILLAKILCHTNILFYLGLDSEIKILSRNSLKINDSWAQKDWQYLLWR